MSDITIQMKIAMAEAEGAIKRKSEPDIEGRFKAAANVTRGHWMCTNEDEQFRSAVGAVMLSYGPDTPEFERIQSEMKSIQMMSAILNAAQAGLSVNLNEADVPEYEPIGLVKLWREGR